MAAAREADTGDTNTRKGYIRSIIDAVEVEKQGNPHRAGALIVLAGTKEAGKREAWARRGAGFFQGRARRNAPTTGRDTNGAPAQPGGAQPAPGRKGAT